MSRRHLTLVPVVLWIIGASGPLAAAQGSFSRTGDTIIGRNLCQATLLKDGRVLVTGGTRTGESGSVFNREAEIYDPETGTFSPTGSMATPRIRHAAVRLDDGRVLVLGGQPDASSSLASAEIFDPATQSFKSLGNMNVPREDPTATLLKDGRVLIVGGTFRRGQDLYSVNISEIFDPKAGTFTLGGNLQAARANHVAVRLPDGRVLIVGGYGPNPLGPDPILVKEVEILDPATGNSSVVGKINEGRSTPSAILLGDGRVLISGGIGLSADPQKSTTSNTVEVFDPATNTSSTPTAMSEGRVSHFAALLADGRVLLAGGTTGDRDHSTASADLFDPVTGKTAPIAPLNEPRSQGAAVSLLDGRVLIVGGARIAGGVAAARLQTAEIYKP